MHYTPEGIPIPTLAEAAARPSLVRSLGEWMRILGLYRCAFCNESALSSEGKRVHETHCRKRP